MTQSQAPSPKVQVTGSTGVKASVTVGQASTQAPAMPVEPAKFEPPQTQPVQDTDGDGLIDTLDLFPTGKGVIRVTTHSFEELTPADLFVPGDPYFVIHFADS